jgi:hypothetical protein
MLGAVETISICYALLYRYSYFVLVAEHSNFYPSFTSHAQVPQSKFRHAVRQHSPLKNLFHPYSKSFFYEFYCSICGSLMSV